jgi:hypothetical protein
MRGHVLRAPEQGPATLLGAVPKPLEAFEPAGRGPVYNITVEGAHNYVTAGGLLVKNCDHLRYRAVCLYGQNTITLDEANAGSQAQEWERGEDPSEWATIDTSEGW